MKIVLLGPPSSGKGTLGEMLSEKLKLPLIGVGHMLRHMHESHPRYAEVKELMASGGLAPNDLAATILKQRLEQIDCANGYILDGYPRDPEQLELFRPQIDIAILLKISIDTMYRRVTGRRLCSTDGKFYNIHTLSADELKACEGTLSKRADDTEEALVERLENYLLKTVKANEDYREKGLLREIDGEPLPEVVLQSALDAVATVEKEKMEVHDLH